MGSIAINPECKKRLKYNIESRGDMIVSMSPFHENTVICTGTLKTLYMESIDIPCFLRFLQRSEFMIALYRILSISLWVTSLEKMAYLFPFFSLSNIGGR